MIVVMELWNGYKKYGSRSCSSVLPNQSSYGVGNWIVEEENMFAVDSCMSFFYLIYLRNGINIITRHFLSAIFEWERWRGACWLIE